LNLSKTIVSINIIKINNQEQLETAWKIRKEVFVKEQNCPEEIEWEFEEESVHFLAIYDGIAAGTARWRKTSNGIKLERFAVLKEFRNKNIASAILENILADVPQNEDNIYLHAQISAARFYEKHGFIRSGENFWEAGIEHVKMRKN